MSHKLCGPGSLAGRRTHGMVGSCMRAPVTVLERGGGGDVCGAYVSVASL